MKRKERYENTDHERDEKPIGAPPVRPARQKSTAAQVGSGMLTGEFLSDSRLRKWFPVGIYCVVLIFIYIGHNFNYQRLQRIEIQTRIELNNEKSRSMVFSSMRMNASRHSRIIEEVRRRGLLLEESTVPPKKIGR